MQAQKGGNLTRMGTRRKACVASPTTLSYVRAATLKQPSNGALPNALQR